MTELNEDQVGTDSQQRSGLDQEVIDAIDPRLSYARSALQRETEEIEDMLKRLTNHIQERDQLENRIRVLEKFLIDNGVVLVKEIKNDNP